MERRAARVSESQWNILLEFLEHHPNLARARGYNNSARGRAESQRLWEEVAKLLNAEGSGTTKTAKDWSIYVSNYKSKLKKIVADINVDANATGGGPPEARAFSNVEERFLAVMGPGFGQTAPWVSVNPFAEPQQASTSVPQSMPQIINVTAEEVAQHESETIEVPAVSPTPDNATAPSPTPAGSTEPPMPRRSWHARYRSRLLAPLDEARRILQQVEMQRAAADAARARALNLIAQNLGRLADSAEKYLSYIESQ